ncbi:DMT family transporter [Geitlerinema sp. PCC 9228]|uniref:DMT family transporter n=1 Tax=Geitlerinema sp. PCC 9228 TaxID=111611 RepID=UPI0009FD9CCE|nr:DMT family transporter [Geitlerinema sp. PCC 9228]
MLSKLFPAKAIDFPFLAIAPFFFWGTAMVAMKGVMPHTEPFFLAGWRILPAGILVLLAAALAGRQQPVGWKAWLWIALFALVDGACFQGFLAWGLQNTGAGLGSVTIDSQPLMVAVLSRWLFGEIIGGWGWLGLSIGIVGISLIGLPTPWIESIARGNLDGIAWEALAEHGQWLMLLAAVSMALGTVLIRGVCRHADPVVATGWHMVLGGMPLFWLSWQTESQPWVDLTAGDWISLGYATVFGSAVAYGLFFFYASRRNLTSLSALTFLTPVFALLFARLFLAETLTLWQQIGVGSTLVSIYLINQRQAIASYFWRFWRWFRTTPPGNSVAPDAVEKEAEATSSTARVASNHLRDR